MPLEKLKKQLNKITDGEFDKLCDIVNELQPYMGDLYKDIDLGRLTDVRIPSEMVSSFRENLEYQFLNNTFELGKKDIPSIISCIEDDMIKKEEGSYESKPGMNGTIVDIYNDKSKKYYKALMHGLVDQKNSIDVKGIKGRDSTINPMYLVNDKTERDNQITFAIMSLTNSLKAIDTAREKGIKKNFVKNHYRNSECYIFLSNYNKTLDECRSIMNEGEALRNRYENEKDMENFPPQKLIESMRMLSKTYERMGKAEEKARTDCFIEELKKEEESIFE